MWNTPTKQELSQIPGLYETEHVHLEDKTIHFHFFFAQCDWFIAEYDGTDTFFGFACLNGDVWNAEWGYLSFEELRNLSIAGIEVDRDLYWDKKPAKEVPLIRKKLEWYENTRKESDHGQTRP